MKLLLDTHALIWWFNDNQRLGPRTRSLIADSNSIVLASVASFWEVSIKYRTGKLADIGSVLMAEALANGFDVIGIENRHLAMLEDFVARPGHRDPFDHLIVVQAMAEDAILVTSDRELRGYDVRCV